MELLTDRLSILVEQVAEHQIEELINKEKLQQQRIIGGSQGEKFISYKAIAAANQAKRSKPTVVATKKNEEQQEEKKQDDKKDEPAKTAKAATVNAIWGLAKMAASNHKNDKNEKGADKGDKGKQATTQAANPMKPNAFKSVAKKLVVFSALKGKRDVCTCEDLNSKCKVHDP